MKKPKTKTIHNVHSEPNRRTYQRNEIDPTLLQIIMLLNNYGRNRKESWKQIERDSGVTTACLRSWCAYHTRRPYGTTMDAVLRTMGYHRPILKKEDNKR